MLPRCACDLFVLWNVGVSAHRGPVGELPPVSANATFNMRLLGPWCEEDQNGFTRISG
jgi:hypothetical protein